MLIAAAVIRVRIGRTLRQRFLPPRDRFARITAPGGGQPGIRFHLRQCAGGEITQPPFAVLIEGGTAFPADTPLRQRQRNRLIDIEVEEYARGRGNQRMYHIVRVAE